VYVVDERSSFVHDGVSFRRYCLHTREEIQTDSFVYSRFLCCHTFHHRPNVATRRLVGIMSVTNQLCQERGIHISTMTVTAKVVGCHLVGKEDYERVFAEFLPVSNRRSRRFNNQYTICVPVGGDSHKLNVKVFRNGTLQISGAKAMSDIHELATVLMLVGKMDIGQYRVAMINSNFDVKHLIDLFNLAMFFRETGMHVNYDNQRHPGLHLRYMYNFNNTFGNGICGCVIGINRVTGNIDRRCTKCDCHKVSVIVFGTGKVVITGASDIYQILEVHSYLVQILNNYRRVENGQSVTSGRRRRRRGRQNHTPYNVRSEIRE